MADSRSFTEYVAKTFDNQFWTVVEEYLHENMGSLDIELYRIHKAGEPEIIDIHVEHVWVDNLPEMKIQFDVALSVIFEIPEADYHYDNSEEKKIWLMVRCRGDLAIDLQDFEIFEVSDYKGRNRIKNPMDDSLVSMISHDTLDEVAEQFLGEHYKKALLEPIWVDPTELAKNMGLSVRLVHITKDHSVFGRCFFYDCETELYDPVSDNMKKEVIPAGTILVDKEVAFLRNLGALNNTIVHECVHWDRHKKAFALVRLYDASMSNVACQVVGGIAGNKRDSVDWMEWQANSLAPRIQMPLSMFKKRVEYLITKYRRELHAYDIIDIIQPIIDDLVVTFGVSRTATKIRLIDAGYEEAMGAFIYLDGHYVKTHKAPKGFLQRNQTFSISAVDAAIQSFSNKELKTVMKSGQYQYVESHFVLNSSLYIEEDEYGNMQLTHYARNHMDECCLVFDLQVKSKFGERYHSECFLNRDEHSTVDFSVIFHGGFENAPHERQMKKLQEVFAEENRIYGQLNANYLESLQTVIAWRNISYKEISERSGLNAETVSRCVKGTHVTLNTLILICLALHLPYKISMKIINDSPHTLSFANRNHQWYEFALQHLYAKKISEIKEFLAEQGADPL